MDDRSATAQALSTVSQVTAINLMMIIPALAGYFVDQRFGTVILFTSVGLVVGVGSSVWQLVQFVRHQAVKDEENRDKLSDDPEKGDK